MSKVILITPSGLDAIGKPGRGSCPVAFGSTWNTEHFHSDFPAERNSHQRPARADRRNNGSKSATGASIIVNDTGIYIQNGKGASIVLTGPTVTVNQGALVVV